MSRRDPGSSIGSIPPSLALTSAKGGAGSREGVVLLSDFAEAWGEQERKRVGSDFVYAIAKSKQLTQELQYAVRNHRLTILDGGRERPYRAEQDARSLEYGYIRVNARSVNAWLASEKLPELETVRPAALDLSMLASRDQLIVAFGASTGMDKSWFDNLTDTPALHNARKHQGQGARGQARQPLFCPYEVMLWLISPTRKKGKERPLSPNEGWRLLKTHFKKVYGQYEVADPRQF